MSIKQNITSLQNLLEQVNALPEEVALPELTNPADASKALSGYEFINEDGEKVTGTIPTKTSGDLTASGATVTVPSGYYATQATKSVTTATQATPSVSIDSAGKITATATQTAGYVTAGTKTGTKQLTTQAAKTVTPTKSSQTAVASGVYTTGAVTVGAIPSQYVDNSSVTAVESDVMSGKKFGANGSVKTGTFSLDTELSTQDDLIAQIQTALQGKAAGGGSGSSGGSLETCTVTLNFTSSGNPRNVWISGTQLVDGSITALSVIDYDGSNSSGVTSPYILTDIIKNSALAISSDGAFSLGRVTCEGCELLYRAISTKTVSCKITDSNASITITNVY